MAQPAVPAPLDRAPTAAREIGVAAAGLVVLGLVAYGLSLGFFVGNLHNGLLALTFTAVGLYVLRMRPGHLIGVLFVVCGLQSAVMFFGRQYGLHEPALPGGDWLAWVSLWQVPLGMAVAGLAIMLFPTGRLPSPQWRVPVVGMVVVSVALAVASALWPVEDDWSHRALEFPFELGDSARMRDVLGPVVAGCYQLFLALWVAAVVVRMRRARGDESRQLRWFVSAVAVMALALAAGVIALGSPVPGLLATALIPVAAGVAIVKHRLYDIDPVVNKSIVVAALVLVITVGYVGVVVGAGALLPVPGGVLSLVATALVALAFEPVRRRAQRLADRWVYGERVTPYEALSRISAQVRERPETLLDGIAAVLANALGATEVVVWVGDAARLVPAAGWPEPAVAAPAALDDLGKPGILVRPVVHRGAVRGAIVIRKRAGEPFSPSEARLLDDLVAQTGLVIDHRGQEQEIRAAARRIVTAGDAARRTIERDLHDGAQQRLVELSLELGVLADRASRTGADDLAERARAARDGLLAATTELRELARGLHPSVLTESGLAAAIEALADRAALPVQVEVALDRRLSQDVEATAYFVVAEALTNVARHAEAAAVTVSVADTGAGLGVVVADDGRGGVDPRLGSGLQGLADRLAALGGELAVESEPGRGTTLRVVIPCA
jgi:signal transduction histidine kinase